MLSIDESRRITISQGDCVTLRVDLKKGGAPISLQEGDKVTLTVKADKADNAIISQTVENAGQSFINFVLVKEDTDEVKAGRYKYDIKIAYAGGAYYAITYPTDFIIREVV